jgi:hypothetical protein
MTRLLMTDILARFITICVVALTTSDAVGWNALGHKVVAEIAWRQLSPEQRKSVVEILRRHPRFDRDFAGKMEDNALTGDKSIEDHWIFLQAATWPDIIRKDKEHDRPEWHYIDLPTFLDESDRTAFAGKLPVNISTEFPTNIPREHYNIVQAIELCRESLGGKAGPEVKAQAYCWLMHLVGDIHQPLHCTALFSKSHFPKGDRGGNEIKLKKGKNLHSLWDNLLGRASYIRNVDGAALELSNKKHYGDVWNSATKEMSPALWAKDGRDLCEKAVYSDAILSAVRSTTVGPDVEPIELPEEYYTKAGEVARKQVITAGLRLGEFLKGEGSQRLQRSRATVRTAK